MNQQKPSPTIDTVSAFNPEFRNHPDQILDQIRSAHPVLHDESVDAIILTRAKDVAQVLNDRNIDCDPRKSSPGSRLRQVHRVDENFRPSLLRMDDPDHKRVRDLVSKAFNQASVDALRPKVEQIASDLLDSLQGRSSFDLIETFAEPFPMAVIAELLQVDTDKREDFLQWSKAMNQLFNPRPTPEQLASLKWGSASFHAYLKQIVDQRREHRGADLISSLITAHEGENTLTEWEIISTCELLLFAGNVTTTDLIGNGMFALLQHPEQMEKLRVNPALLPGAIEEMLRYDSPVTHVARVARDSPGIDGCPFHAGQTIYSLVNGANHDPALHLDAHAFDIERENKRHYSFGGGAHFCLGAPLARAEAQIAFSLLLKRFPSISLKPGAEPVRKITPSFRGLESLWLTVPSTEETRS
ncbi:cytochrome P450 [Granulicella mallensis]|uniref:Linalool 8-monooxygenase n=1 Tax=Granulicella mallensis (strain ATCC BAA-1857 / DSM 23137 / MP5ACTX8) TaxID=682795 RepID=G8NRC7_GRAMM|nr:cytochrome P450 [Granulicella mallensis]AEU36205.1 Linalool 8-monooxygenase [Granulicella mallensis MP5ACTX8]